MNPPTEHRDPLSTVVKSLSTEQLDKLDSALAAGSPLTLAACYEQFELADLGISMDAFYRYARRFRSSLRALALTHHGVSDTDASETIIPRLVGQRMIRALMTDEFTPRTLLRLAEAYRMTSEVELRRRRLDMVEESAINLIATATNHQPLLPASNLLALPDTGTSLASPSSSLTSPDPLPPHVEDLPTE